MTTQPVQRLLEVSAFSGRRKAIIHLAVLAALIAFADFLVPFYVGLVLAARRQVIAVGALTLAFASVAVFMPELIVGQRQDGGAGPEFWMTFYRRLVREAALASILAFLAGILLRQAVSAVAEVKPAVAAALASALMLFGGYQLATQTADEGAARLRQVEETRPAWSAANEALDEIGRIGKEGGAIDPDLISYHKFRITLLSMGQKLPDHMLSLEAFKEHWKQERAKIEEHLRQIKGVDSKE